MSLLQIKNKDLSEWRIRQVHLQKQIEQIKSKEIVLEMMIYLMINHRNQLILKNSSKQVHKK